MLRNRVSAQQARERKKAYLSELEVRVKDLEKKNSELEERLSTLQNENQMLRQVSKFCFFISVMFSLLFFPISNLTVMIVNYKRESLPSS